MPTTEYIIKINGKEVARCCSKSAAKAFKEFYEMLLYTVEIEERDLLV